MREEIYMKKLDNDSIIVLSFKLCLVCLFMTLILAYLNSVTKPRILAAKEKEAALKMGEIVSGASFSEMTDAVYKAEIDGKEAGYVVKAVTTKGYGGNIDMLVGFSDDFSVLGISFAGDFSETPGLGTRVKEKAFINKFIGKKDIEIVTGQANGENEVDAVTGATISSRAVGDGVQKAAEILKEALK